MRFSHISFIGILIFLLGGYFFYTSYNEVGLFAGKIDAPVSGEQILRESTLPKVCFRNPKVRFFMYHYIRDDDTRDTQITHNLSIPPKLFEQHMSKIRQLADSGSISLIDGDDFLESVDSQCFPASKLWIFTADDGWSDTYSSLVPIATQYHVPFFLGIIGDRIGVPGFVTRGEVYDIAQNPLFTISSHSMTHDDESLISREKEQWEMCESKELLETIIGKNVSTYIYPSGKMNSGSTENLRSCGYSLAWTTQFGKEFGSSSGVLSDINRIRITRETPVSFFDDIANGN